jgi:EXLDI family protein
MPNKTIYVSETDASLFEEAKQIAGEALSSVIVRALREFVARHEEKEKGMKEIALHVGGHGSEREKRFVGQEVGKWSGFSDDKEWYLEAKIYRTQKNNWVVFLVHVCKASLLIDKKKWKESGDYLIISRSSELLIGDSVDKLQKKLPMALLETLQGIADKYETPVEYLDI